MVSADDGDPVAGGPARSLRPVEGPEYLITAGTKADGRFVVHRVQPDRYRLQANARGFLLAEQEIQVASGRRWTIWSSGSSPAPGAKVRVRLASGQVPSLMHVLVRDPAGGTVLAETRHGTHPERSSCRPSLPAPGPCSSAPTAEPWLWRAW